MRRAIHYVVAIFAALPLAFVVTFLMSPFWNWFESASGIESFGHSGPAEWCFYLTYAVLLVGLFVAITILGKRR